MVSSFTSQAPESISPNSPYFQTLFRRRQQKKMSITQTYYLAHTARKKLTREASRADHDLRLLVGHANLLDSLMVDLAEAEREQERWFNQTVHGATKAQEETRRVQWASTMIEETEEEYDLSDDNSDLDSDSDSDEEDEAYTQAGFVINPSTRRRPVSPPPMPEPALFEEEDDDTDSDFEYDDGEGIEDLSLTRSPSRQSPPELLPADSDDESEDDALPISPPQPTLEAFDQKTPTTTTISLTDSQPLFDTGYFASQDASPIIEAY
ncbi:hypothetical protein N7468_005320 [Penicillium chermesinum]|uniref:Uncharacterized protein n=1 Tax=Penicillium chermesinum TaxID=63820 RepID=A0A9W9NZ06_9EURO|nr:uncharacterized protein N7468_005320 [Penicillium chermesinum]KAJ5232364.1 hypothetical protein N7468_005320 [Penicillium chermesinum]